MSPKIDCVQRSASDASNHRRSSRKGKGRPSSSSPSPEPEQDSRSESGSLPPPSEPVSGKKGKGLSCLILLVVFSVPVIPFLAALFIPQLHIPMDILGHTLMPFCSVCCQFFGLIPGSVYILQISSDNLHPVFPWPSRFPVSYQCIA